MKRAASWIEVGALPLSRRDRAAMELGLESLRLAVSRRVDAYSVDECGVEWAREALQLGWLVSSRLRQAAWTSSVRVGAARLLRARLALALRVLLRVDRGDYGPVEWSGCRCNCDGDAGGWLPRRYTAAWESAPQWEAGVTPEMRRAAKVAATARDAMTGEG
jgi:hypothetical protein